MKILVTGSSSGLGKFLSENLKCDVFNRNKNFESLEYDVIIHCAWDCRNTVNQRDLLDYVNNNIFLTKRLIEELKFKKMIFLSSVDVYPKNSDRIESSDIDVNLIKNIYGKSKLICEEIVKKSQNYLILRSAGIIGKNKLPKGILNIFKNGETTLTSDSVVNYITHGDILSVINQYINCDIIKNETINVTSDTSLYMKEMECFVYPIKYGTYNYDVDFVDNTKFKNCFPNIKLDSSKNNLSCILKQLEYI